MVLRGHVIDAAYMVCGCCGVSDAGIDREGGCRCDYGTCRVCDPEAGS